MKSPFQLVRLQQQNCIVLRSLQFSCRGVQMLHRCVSQRETDKATHDDIGAFLRLAFTVLILTAWGVLTSQEVQALEPYKTFSEAMQSADLIFLGTASEKTTRQAENGTMIFTDTHFKDITIVLQRRSLEKVQTQDLRVGMAGGSDGKRELRVSGIPVFEVGVTYLVALYSDDPMLISPIAGAFSGVYPIIHDEELDKSYPLTLSRQGIVSIAESGDLNVTPPVITIANSNVQFAKSAPAFDATPPVASMKSGSSAVVRNSDTQATDKNEGRILLDLDAFIALAKREALKEGN